MNDGSGQGYVDISGSVSLGSSNDGPSSYFVNVSVGGVSHTYLLSPGGSASFSDHVGPVNIGAGSIGVSASATGAHGDGRVISATPVTIPVPQMCENRYIISGNGWFASYNVDEEGNINNIQGKLSISYTSIFGTSTSVSATLVADGSRWVGTSTQTVGYAPDYGGRKNKGPVEGYWESQAGYADVAGDVYPPQVFAPNRNNGNGQWSSYWINPQSQDLDHIAVAVAIPNGPISVSFKPKNSH